MSDHDKTRDQLIEELRRLRERVARLEAAEPALRESEERFRQVAEHVREVFWLVDLRQWRVVYISPAYEEVWGRSCQSLYDAPLSWLDAVHPEDRPRIEASIRGAGLFAPGGRMYRVVRPDGSVRWVRDRAFAVRDRRGEVYRAVGIAEDVTEQRRTEEALRESEELFRQVADNIQDVLWISDPRQPRVFYVSPAYERIWGRKPDALYADPLDWVRAIHPDDRERVARTFRELNLQGDYDTEYRIVRPDGTVRWIRDRGSPVRNAAGAVYRVAGTASDVTARKAAEERFAKAFGASPVPISISTVPEGRFVDVNDSYLRLFGYARGEMVGHTVYELGTWADPAERGRLIGVLRDHGQVRSAEVRLRTKAGATRDCLLSIELIDLDGEPHLLAFIHDITERKRIEAELRESEERLRRFFEATFEGIAFHEGGVIVDANHSLARLFGYEPGELVGKHVLELAAPEARATVRDRILADDERAYETVGLRKDGSTFDGEVCGKPVSYRGRTARVTAVRDITPRKRAERKLQEYARRLQVLSRRLLEVQEDERRHLARELHDEVGQALTGLNLTLETGARLPDDGLRQALRAAQQAVRELTGKVRDLSLRLRPSMLDDLGLVPALVWHLERYTAQTQVQVEFAHEGLGHRLHPDVETAAYRIVQEGLTNVARHAGVGRCAVRLWLAGDTLHVEVEDPGRGFDAEAALARGASSGLSGMRERAELIGGRLAVHSSPGRGTRLTAELPVRNGVA